MSIIYYYNTKAGKPKVFLLGGTKMKEQKQKNRWGIKTAYALEDLDFYGMSANVGVAV